MPYNYHTRKQHEGPILYRDAYRVLGDGTVGPAPAFRVMTYVRDDGETVTVALDPGTMEMAPAGHPVYPGPTYTGTQEYGPSLWNQEQHYGLLELGEEQWEE